MRVGSYELLSEIGRGGGGIVYRARGPDGRIVALKGLKEPSAEKRAFFARETRLLSSFGEAEGFVPLLEAGETASGPYLVMPFLAGGTLRDRLAPGRLSVAETVALARALARALGHAHAKGIVHRDLKPENVLFTVDGRPLVADLGLAKHFDRGAPGASATVTLSKSGDAKGTPSYMAPEQMADAALVGPAADVYALGAILYECLAGRRAFDGANMVEIMRSVLDGRHEPIAPGTDAPAWLVALIERSLSRDPSLRPRDGIAFLRAIEGRTRRRRVVSFVLGGLLVFAVAPVLLVAERSRRGAAPGTEPAGAPVRSRAPQFRDPGFVLTGATPSEADLRRLVDDLTRQLERDPGDARSRANRAAARSALRDHAGARADFDAALAVLEGSAVVWHGRAELRRRAKDDAGAVGDYTKAIELDPKLVGAWYGRGESRANLDDRPGAIGDYSRAIELDGRLADAWASRGAVRVLIGDEDGAFGDLTRAVELDPEQWSAWSNRAMLRERRGDEQGAFDDVSRAVAVNPKNSRGWFNRGIYHERRKDDVAAHEDFTRAVEADPGYTRAWFNRGCLLARRGDEAGAFADFERTVELDPKHARAWTNLGSFRSRRGDEVRALADYARAIEADPRYARAFLARGLLLAKRGESASALADLETALGLGLGAEDEKTARAQVASLGAALRR